MVMWTDYSSPSILFTARSVSGGVTKTTGGNADALSVVGDLVGPRASAGHTGGGVPSGVRVHDAVHRRRTCTGG
ncbi:hypothetical protein [Streptomyces sp. NPDC055140]